MTITPQLAARMGGVDASAVREILKLTERPEVLSMAGGLPAAGTFDVEGIGRAFATVLGGDQARSALQYSVTEGDPRLRDQLALLTRERGIEAEADRVLVTTGSQQALDLTVTALLDAGDTVIVERPCYLAALQLFRLMGVNVVPAHTDEDGLDPDAARAAVREHGAKAIYTVATFQNPTGVTLAADRRRALAELAAEEDVWIVEDDPYGELRYQGEAVAPVATHDPERVVYVSTLSKVVSPGLRIGWVVAPPPLRQALAVAKQARDLHTSTLDQRAAAEYLASGALGAHLVRLRAQYGARLQALLDGLPAATPEGSRWTTPDGGMFAWLTLPDGDAADLLPGAIEEGVAFVPGAHFFATDPDPRTARLSFVTLTPDELTEALARLGRALRR